MPPREHWPLGTEALDTPHLDSGVARATLSDIATANALFGGRAAVAYGVERLLAQRDLPPTVRVLDVGAGKGDVLGDLARRWRRRGIRIDGLALDWHREAARLCRRAGLGAVVADAVSLPLADCAVDVVVASQLLHHFPRRSQWRLVRELTRVARIGVVVADLRRARLARWGIWLASFPLGFHRVSREDGVLSVRRGFEPREVSDLLADAGFAAEVKRRPGYRIVAHWRVPDADR